MDTMTAQEIADYLNVTRQRVDGLRQSEDLPQPVETDPRRWDRAEIEQWAEREWWGTRAWRVRGEAAGG